MRSCLISLLFFCLCGFSLPGQDGFPYPDVPDSLLTQESRINYLTSHFWDKVDFNNSRILETSKPVLNYIYLIQNANEKISDEGLRSLFELTGPFEDFFNGLIAWFSHFLHDAHSPLYDDNLYSRILSSALESNVSVDVKNDLRAKQKVVSQNQLDGVANDFDVEDKAGERFSLSAIKAQYLLLFFSNPICSICDNTEKLMSASEPLNLMLSDGILKVLVVCPEENNYDGWFNHKYPDNWMSGFDITGVISSNRLYDIQYYPSFYLLDEAKKVLMKEAAWQDVERVLYTICRQYYN